MTLRDNHIAEALEFIREALALGFSGPEMTQVIGYDARNLILRYAPELHPTMIRNGQWSQGRPSRKLSPGDLEEVDSLSANGFGVDWIGKKFSVDGTTIMSALRKRLGMKEYMRRHPVSKYRGGAKGYRKNKRGDKLQSSYEEGVADYLFLQGIEYLMHTVIRHSQRVFYPDFFLPRTEQYIEVLGMSDMRFYRERTKVKKAAYSQEGIDCCWLEKSDMMHGIPSKLKEFLCIS